MTEASKLLGLSERQIIRLRKGVQKNGRDAVKHGNTGIIPATTTTPEQINRIIELYKEKYYNANFQHFKEMLEENENIIKSVSTIRRILLANGIKSPKTKRKPKKHIRRKRREHEGALVQMDATPHDFFGTGAKCCLHGAVDDATGKIVGLYMTKNECLEGYFNVFEQMIGNFGIPASIYADRHTIFSSQTAGKLSIEDELAGKQANDTQLGRAVRELGITLIKARSPQAKGRIERLWGTLQDRLTIEFRINGISDLETANEFLLPYILRYNQRFAVEAVDVHSLFAANTFDLIDILCVREKRKLDSGGSFSFYGQQFVVEGGIQQGVSIEVIAHHKFGIFAFYQGSRYGIFPIDKPKQRKRPVSVSSVRTLHPMPVCSKYRDYNKNTYIHYSSEYTDSEILAILDCIFSNEFY